ncbi:hypothetical protein [Salinarimonas soli]|uniref:Uncharacterized protein n=1 Tax=Salinarimonas soli TaxID=1638099 RepID=A0A5B2V8L0_9HYPH|nr:hypothetical protein [Salinarimonas soli]KAA2235311.1 hypothetical protein F0L46_20045 [Salinarimonas soli]
MIAAVRAGPVYVGLVFAVGFALGTLRVLVVEPRLGGIGAVAVELPLMLAASWIACGAVLRRWPVPPQAGPRFLMGAIAFAALMTLELAVAVLGLGRSPAEHLASYREADKLMGLAGQLLFAVVPLLR